MIQKIRSGMGKLGEEKGFTLVEMALVLIIIGIIIGAIVKGKDLVRSAEQKRVYSKFLNEWRLAYLNFYDRTGKILGDTWNTSATPAAVGQDGQADTAHGTAGAPDDTGRGELVTGDGTAPVDYLGLNNAGLQPAITNTANNYTYNYVDSQGTTHTLTIAFDFDTTVGSRYNYMEIQNIPSELALAIDTMIDGQADGGAGDFINNAGPGNAWDASPTTDNTARWRMKF